MLCAGGLSPRTLLPVWLFPVLDSGSCAVGRWFTWMTWGAEQVPAWDPLGTAQTTHQLHLKLLELQILPLHKQPPPKLPFGEQDALATVPSSMLLWMDAPGLGLHPSWDAAAYAVTSSGTPKPLGGER